MLILINDIILTVMPSHCKSFGCVGYSFYEMSANI